MNISSHARRSSVTRNAIGVGLATGVYGISFGALAVTSGFSFAQTQVLSLGLFSGILLNYNFFYNEPHHAYVTQYIQVKPKHCVRHTVSFVLV